MVLGGAGIASAERMMAWPQLGWIVLAALACAISSGCYPSLPATPPRALPPVAGEEATDLVARIHGYVLTSHRLERGPLSAIRVVELPGVTWRSRRYGDRVAFVRDLTGTQMPGAFINVGTLEVWDVQARRSVHAESQAVDMGISRFPDGHRVAYVKFLPRDMVPTPHDDKDFGRAADVQFEGWSHLTTVVVLDVEKRETMVVGLGRLPVVSTDGRKVLVRDREDTLRAFDVVTGTWIPVSPPGLRGALLAYSPATW